MLEMFLPSLLDSEDKNSLLKNCIRNNYRHLRKWAKRTGTNCFRLYDRERHEYPLTIDLYGACFYVQYYSKGDGPSPSLLEEVQTILYSLFKAREDSIFWRTRSRSRPTRQHEKRATSREFFIVQEYGVKFWVNLVDYLDTGLFLDHRETRQLAAQLARGKRVLNLFAYTCAFSVQAAMQGALSTKSIDMSNTYTAWGRRNFHLNQLSERTHEIIRADCLKFLKEERSTYDLIILDPPTLSRSKKMTQLFDIQSDYIPLLLDASKLLAKDGTILFSTNARTFTFESERFPHLQIQEITHKTIPPDFRDTQIHRCWKMYHSL
jgi:23S rRNA (cytosine1962-C5)-methyltransferase